MRIRILDWIRGADLISMIIYHLLWDLVYLYGTDWDWYRTGMVYFWQQSICWIFILLSGFCWSLGKHRWRRGLLVLFASALVSLATLFVLPEERIVFGVLTLLGSCMLILIPLEFFLRRVPGVVGLILSGAAFFVLRNVNDGVFGFEKLIFGRLPKSWYRNIWTAYLGFPGTDFESTDYFSLIPWLLLFLCGYFLYRIFREHALIPPLPKHGGMRDGVREISAVLKGPAQKGKGSFWRLPALLGRHSLLIYLVHQPLLYLILQIIHR